jgi:hypothetical protein
VLTYEELLDLNSKRRICQIGILTANMEDTLQKMVEIHHIGPWVVCDIDETHAADSIQVPEYCEKHFKMRIGICNLGNTQLEVIQPFYGLPVYQKQLDAGVGMIHHLKEGFNDETMPLELEKYAASGERTVFAANLFNSRFAYLESVKDIGFFFELGNSREANLPDDFDRWYYPEPART